MACSPILRIDPRSDHTALVGVAGAFVGYHIGGLLALSGGLVTSVIAAAVGAAVVLFGRRMAK